MNDGHSTTKLLLAFNDRVAPFNNAKVRKAVTSAIDNKKLLQSIWGDYGTLIGSMVPPTDPWYEDLTGVNPYDVELAKQLLAEAGYAERVHASRSTPRTTTRTRRSRRSSSRSWPRSASPSTST